jgi:predicted XRE-type DNA-binding protein
MDIIARKTLEFLGGTLERLSDFPKDEHDRAEREMKKLNLRGLTSVWDAIADSPQEAENLRLRADLMDQLCALIEANGWTQVDAAARCGISQPRMNDLLRDRISRFSLDALVNIAAALGKRVQIELIAA